MHCGTLRTIILNCVSSWDKLCFRMNSCAKCLV
jgi:hypothetical protein